MIYHQDSEIIIRDIKKEDTPFLFSWWVDKTINRHDPRILPADPQSLMKECMEYCINFEREVLNEVPELNVYRYFIITDKEDTPVGFINIFDYIPETEDIELGIIIGDKRYWQRGIGTKSLKIILNYLFKNMTLKKIHVETGEYNLSAINLFNKLGFKKCGEYLENETFKYIIMEIFKEQIN